MLERTRRWSTASGLMVMVVLLLVFTTAAKLFLSLPPRDAKPVVKADPGLTQLEDHELGNGILHVLRNRETGELVGVYEIAGRDPVIAVMGGAGTR